MVLFTLLICFSLYVVFRIISHCLRDKHKCTFWCPKSDLGVFYRQYQHQFISSQSRPGNRRKQLDPCGAGPSQLQDGPYLLTMNANVSEPRTFWFDQIQYAPSVSVSLNQSLLRIDPSDSAIQFSPGWQSMDGPISFDSNALAFKSSGNISYTQTMDANLIYQFSGS